MKVQAEYDRRKNEGSDPAGANLPPTKKGKSRDRVGAQLGISGRSVDKAAKIGEALVKLKDDPKDLKELRDATMKSFDAGYTLGVEKGWILAPKAKQDTAKNSQAKPVAKVEEKKPVAPPPPDSKKAKPVEVPPDDDDTGTDEETPTLYELTVEAADALLTYTKALNGNKLSAPQKAELRKIFHQITDAQEKVGF